MSNHVAARSRHLERTLGLFILMLLAVFATELAVTQMLNTLLVRLDPVTAGLADALLLMLFFAPPLWIVCDSQIPVERGGTLVPAKAPVIAMIKVLLGIFLIELLVMMILPLVMMRADAQARELADACLTTLLSAPALWWLLFRRKAETRRVPLSDLLGLPLRLYVLLLILIFLVDLMQTLLFSQNLPGLPIGSDKVIDAFLTTIVIAPVLWLLVIRPLKKVAQSDRARANAIHYQANDAVVTLTAQGIITSFNPAAERIFGYRAGEMTGEAAGALFPDGRQGLDALISSRGAHDDATLPCQEVTGKRSDGTPLTLEVSMNRMELEEGGYLLIMRDVSDRKKAQQVLLESLSLQTATLESTADGILAVDLGYRVRTFNRKFLEMWQVSAELLERGDRQALLTSLLAQLKQPGAVLEEMEQLYSQPEQTAIRDIRLKDGRVFECYSYPQVLDASVVGRVWSFRDISEKTKAQEALRESEELFRQVFDQTEDAIIIFNFGTCIILDLNSKAEKVFGYPKAELLDLGLEGLCRKQDFPELCGAIVGISQERGAQLDNIVSLRKDGSEILVTMRGKIMKLQGSQVVYCTFRDVTDRIRMEQEARNIQSRLIQANKMTSLGLLVSGVAHEINNPNSFIMANSRLLSAAWLDALKFLREYHRENGEFLLGGVPFSQLDAHSRELFAGILDGTQRIEAIINNLKGFARQDRAGAGAEVEVDLNKVANSAVSLLHHELVKFTANFHVDLAQKLPSVKGNNQQLGQVLINLLTNACHALPDKQCGIWLATGYDEAAGVVTISVRDEGCGITRDDGSRIMEPFFTTKLDSGGTGLGLSICCAIVKDHAGTLEYSSEPGKGTTFTVRLPAHHPA
jgi:PAS domain S-box-containing protein